MPSNEYMRKYLKKRSKQFKEKIFKHYTAGTMECQCERCNVKGIEFLTVDHVNGDGYKHKSKGAWNYMLYKKIIDDGFPDTYKILCWNCNCTKKNNSKCGHYT